MISRNSHRSVYHTAFLRQLKIEYLYEDINKDTNIPEAVGLEEVKRGLEEYPEAVLVVLTSPTYEGRQPLHVFLNLTKFPLGCANYQILLFP